MNIPTFMTGFFLRLRQSPIATIVRDQRRCREFVREVHKWSALEENSKLNMRNCDQVTSWIEGRIHNKLDTGCEAAVRRYPDIPISFHAVLISGANPGYEIREGLSPHRSSHEVARNIERAWSTPRSCACPVCSRQIVAAPTSAPIAGIAMQAAVRKRLWTNGSRAR
jgi:hypothetical protein